ncbi:LuxR C-terminal-related transcriptional regulator [Actinophytocola oryzae]|uniref:LuxR family two component transcriptional regulator n=1 Tax=Actinophytocola oryzae TaxID=502181 RepID=A0A4R7VNC9_9PSEU|nr:response regulator transcription factor [Actinophytocola oryzae]TDV50727.1 LuxR family two component transcriptional regulator [Actinophytocola oryzae]
MPPSTKSHTTNGAAVGVALIDGVPLVREGLSALVHRSPGLRWVGAAENPSVGIRLCERMRPDVVVIDAVLDPRGQLGRHLAGEFRVILMVDEAHLTPQYVANAVSGGIHGLIRRNAQPAQLMQAIHTVHTEGRYLDPVLTESLTAPLTRPRRSNGTHQPLSQREHEVLRLIADGLENQAIANLLFVSVETVRTHVKSILRKLASRDRTHAVAVAFRSGVLTVDEGAVPR